MDTSRLPRAHYGNLITSYVTTPPYSVPSDCTLRSAVATMIAHDLRHLPVMEGTRVAGLLRESDLHALERCGELPFDTTTAAEVMCFDVYFAHPSATLGAVVQDMRRCRFDHAILIDRTALVGVFTVTDALRILAEELCASEPPQRLR